MSLVRVVSTSRRRQRDERPTTPPPRSSRNRFAVKRSRSRPNLALTETGRLTPPVRHDRGMSLGAKSVAVVLAVAGAVLAGAAAPPARAHGADAVIGDLQAEGYIVNINWVNGFNTQQLSDCTVVRVNNPSSNDPMPGDAVYVDVTCPNNLY